MIGSDGLVLTNHHVVEGATEITGTVVGAEGRVTALGQTITATDQNGGNAETLNALIGTNARSKPASPADRWSTPPATS